MDISAFLAAYGKPLAGSESKKRYNFSIYGDRTHDDPPVYDLTATVAWSSPAPYTSLVVALWLSAPKGIMWDETTAINQCLALAPADAVYKGQKKISDQIIERIYESPALAKQLGETLFSDQKGHLVKPGTFYMLLEKHSEKQIFACTDQTDEFF